MFNFLPPSPPSPPMSHAEKMMALRLNSSTDYVVKKQKKIRSLSQSFLKEVESYLEYKAEEQNVESGAPRELPIFFVKGYNELKRMAKEIGYEDGFLNFLPNGVQMQVLTELGHSVPFPKTVTDYFLEDIKGPFVEEVKRLQEEVIFYLKNGLGSSPRLKELPVGYHLTVMYLQQRVVNEETTDEEKQLIGSIHRKMQKILEDTFPRKVRGGFVEDCVYAHNLDI